MSIISIIVGTAIGMLITFAISKTFKSTLMQVLSSVFFVVGMLALKPVIIG